MSGSPLLRALIAFLAILSLGYPLSRVTRSESPAVAAQTPVVMQRAQPIQLQIDFTTAPAELKVFSLGKIIWTASAPAAHLEHALPIAFPPEGVDLRFRIDWPPQSPLAAARVRLTDPAGDIHEKTIWASGPSDEVLTFP